MDATSTKCCLIGTEILDHKVGPTQGSAPTRYDPLLGISNRPKGATSSERSLGMGVASYFRVSINREPVTVNRKRLQRGYHDSPLPSVFSTVNR